MRVKIFSRLLLFVLGCNATAAIRHEILEEKDSIFLFCRHAVEREVTWSRERDGRKVDIITTDGERDIRHIRDSRYRSLAHKSLSIHTVAVSDSGRYLCNNKPVMELTVVPAGTVIVSASEGTSITLMCPHDAGGCSDPTWIRDTREVQKQKRFYVSPVDNTLTIIDVQLGDSGLYFCAGEPAVYLNVVKGNETPATPTRGQTAAATTEPSTPDTTATKKKRKKNCNKKPTTPSTAATLPAAAATVPSTSVTETATDHQWQMSVRLAIGILYLIIMISITVTTWTKARQIKRLTTETGNDL